MFRGDALGVELYAVDGVLAVREAHDQTVVGLGSDLQRVRERVAVDKERMVEGRHEPVRQAGVQAAVGMLNADELAGHGTRRAHELDDQRLPTTPLAAPQDERWPNSKTNGSAWR